jgi:hypothetical protein
MKNTLTLFLLVLMLSSCASTAFLGKKILEVKTTAGLKIDIETIDGVEFLTVSGVPIYSDRHGVEYVAARKDGDSMNILVFLTTSSAGAIEFNRTIILDENIQKVTYGTEKTIIWSRSIGVHPQ